MIKINTDKEMRVYGGLLSTISKVIEKTIFNSLKID